MTTITLHNVKRTNGRVWMLRWYDSRGKRCGDTIGKVGVMTKRHAEAIRRDRQGKIDNGLVKSDKPKRMTLAQFKTHHAEIARGEVSPRTLLEFGHSFQWAERIIGGDTQLTSIGAVHVARIRNAMADKGRQPPTIDKTLAKLRAAFSRGQRLGLVTDNPFAKFKVRNAGRAKASVIRSREEIRKLKAEAPNVWWRSLIGLWFTGLRRDEALQLKWPQVDFESGEISIDRCNGGSFAHDGTTHPLLAWEPKTEQSIRTVPIAPDTMAALRQLQRQSDGSVYAFLSLGRLGTIQGRIDAGSWRADSELVNNLLRDFQGLQRRVLGDDINVATVHDSRKAFCTHMSDLIPIQALADIVGDTPKVLSKYYTKTRKAGADTLRKSLDDGPALKLVG